MMILIRWPLLVAATEADITEALLQRLEIIRLYWDESFQLATKGRRFSDSTL